jgi:hypothetical protein
MNWDAIGAIAELIGAGAVVLTLLYLSIQLRQNTEAVRHSAERIILEDAITWMYKLAENPELTGIYLKGIRGEELDSNDKLRFRMLIGALFNHWNHAYGAGAFDIVDNSSIAGVLSQPGGADYWKRSYENKDMSYDPGFAKLMNDILQDVQGNT